jgi:hypothetical protein
MSDDVNIRISATDNATATLRSIQGELGKFSASIKNIASLTVAGLGVRELGSFLGSSVREFAEAEKSATKLRSVLQATGNTTKLTFGQINYFTDELEKSTGTSAESLNDAAANLARFSNITGDSFKDVLTLANDMSKVLGQDVTSSVMVLGKALNNPAEGLSRLSRLGVSFSESQKAQIEMLDTLGMKAQAQAKILDEIRRQFGGAAEAYGGTVAGQLDILNARIGDLKEAIGETLANAILPLINEVTGKPDSLATSAGALGASQVGSQERKNIELAAVNQQIAILEQQRRNISQELRDNRGTILGSLGAWAGFTVPREDRIAEIQARVRQLNQQREAITAQAIIDQAQSSGGMGAIGATGALLGRLGSGFGGMLNGQSGQLPFGLQINQPGIGEIAGGIGQRIAQDLFGDLINQAQFGGMLGGNQEKQRQEVERSLAATESRFLTRGRGQMSMGEQKNLEEQKKTNQILARMAKAFEELGKGNLLLVEGID